MNGYEGHLHMHAPPTRCHTVQQALQMLPTQETDGPRPRWTISKRHCLLSTNVWDMYTTCIQTWMHRHVGYGNERWWMHAKKYMQHCSHSVPGLWQLLKQENTKPGPGYLEGQSVWAYGLELSKLGKKRCGGERFNHGWSVGPFLLGEISMALQCDI